MKKTVKSLGIAVLAAMFVFTLVGCKEPEDDPPPPLPPSVINIAAIQGVTAPAYGGTPVTVITENAQYSGTVTWSPSHSTFAAITQYTATITLTPKNGYTLQGVAANFFTVAGATSVSNNVNSGVITAVFPLITSTSGNSTRQVTIDMYDSDGDGWNGNGALRIKINGIDIANNVKVQSESSNTYTFNVTTGDVVQLYWVAGNYQEENSFIVYYTDTPPSPAFTAINNNSWNGSNALVYKRRDTMNSIANGTLLGSFTVGNVGETFVDITAIQGITIPVTGGIPVTTITENSQYSGTVTWSGNPSIFAVSTVYTATITLTAKAGFTLQGVEANFFTVEGATSVSNNAGSGVITAVFPQTVVAVINIPAIQGVTAPVNGRTPVTSITENTQYSGTVTWSPSHSIFAAITQYTATITLTPKTGYTLQGVAANFFTVAGATTVSNNANSGVITAVFQSTNATVINISAIQGVTAPVTGAIPVTSITENDQYSGTVTWNGNPSAFAATTQYTATITLTPKTGYTLQGVTANFFKVTGATSVSNNTNSGVITAVFPQTAAIVINISAIQGVTAPVTGMVPVTSITANEQYSGTITWNGNPSTFAAATQYTATITLTAKTGYTLQGVAANFFTVAGATSVSNNANSGVITAKFPQTDALTSVNRIEYYWVDQHGSLVTTSGGKTTIATGETLTITAQSTGYIVKQWYLNGVNTGQSSNTYKFTNTATGKHVIGLFVEKDGKLYNTNITITVGGVTVTFDINGGTGTTPASQIVIVGSSITLPNGSGLSKTNYTFGGWNTNTSGTGTNYNAGASYNPTDNITLYAKWNINGSETSPFFLTDGTWENGSITSSDSSSAVWYSFNVISGTTYRIWWNDSYQGNSTKNLDVKVDASYSNGTTIFTAVDSAYTTAQSFTANQNGTVRIKIYPYSSGNIGTFAVVYSTSSTRP